ncbi:MAG: LytR C-terminal domain-containing protein, partial [FCB group bacterium]|nr:LytR C-terminal domain-containing protein [FCB group bacterium]
ALGAIIALVFIVSFAVKITKGVAKTVTSPSYSVRLQVVNGSGKKGVSKTIKSYLANYHNKDLTIKVVETDNFNIKDVSRSFIIARERDKKAAVILAKKLGLDYAHITYKPLENNYRLVSATLVLGKDYNNIKLAENIKKE